MTNFNSVSFVLLSTVKLLQIEVLLKRLNYIIWSYIGTQEMDYTCSKMIN